MEAVNGMESGDGQHMAPAKRRHFSGSAVAFRAGSQPRQTGSTRRAPGLPEPFLVSLSSPWMSSPAQAPHRLTDWYMAIIPSNGMTLPG